jgi:uncharacterized protein
MKKVLFLSVLFMLACLIASAQNVAPNQTDSKGLKQGLWEEKTATGISKGQFVNDQKDGNWISYGANGNFSKLEVYSKGMRDGIYIEIDQRGYLVSEMYYKNNLLDGTAKKFFYGTNPASVIEYKEGKMNGKKKVYYENAAGKLTEESSYTNDIKDGPSNFFSSIGDPIAEYMYRNGLLEGIQKTYYPGKKLMNEQEYLHNIEQGLYKEYYENGSVKMEGKYENGLKSGKWSEFGEDGKLKADGMYVNDQKEGKWAEYDATGKAIKYIKYVNGAEKQ